MIESYKKNKMNLLEKQEKQLGKGITKRAKEIYLMYFEKEVTEEISDTKEYLAILKGLMDGGLIDYERTEL